MTHTKTIYSTAILGLALLATFLFTQSAFAAQWYLQHTEVAKPLYDVHAITATSAVAVGQSGTIVYTTDGGDTWTAATSGTSKHLYAIAEASPTILYAAGFNGTIDRSLNGGVSWSTLTSGTSSDLWAAAFVGKKTGIVAGEGGKILQTTDGTTFTSRSTGTTNDLFGSYAADATTIYVVGKSGTILKSKSSGMGWSPLISGTTEHLYAIWCSSATHCIAVGNNGTVIETTDGSAWHAFALDLNGEAGLSIDGYDADHFSVGAGSDSIYTTANGGATFTQTDQAEDSPSYSGITYYDANTLYLSGENPGGDGVIWKNDTIAPTTPSNVNFLPSNPSASDTVAVDWDASTDSESGVNYYAVTVVGEKFYVVAAPDTEVELDAMTDGQYTVLIRAVDVAGNEGDVYETTLTIDTIDPTVSAVSPISAYTIDSTTLTVSARDATSGIASCELAMNGFTVGTMSHVSGSNYSLQYAFTIPGTYSAFAACLDAAGNATAGAVTNVTVAVGPGPIDEEPPVTPDPEAGGLVKLACPGGEDASHPCRAVYWVGPGAERHAFPNDKVYFSWFTNFDDVIEVSESYLSGLTLKGNVTYKPGSKMVKFPSVDKVYAVGTNGELRWVTTEAVAIDLYGSAWNTFIDDINIAFYFNYSYGADINAAGDYSIPAAQAAMSSPNDLF